MQKIFLADVAYSHLKYSFNVLVEYSTPYMKIRYLTCYVNQAAKLFITSDWLNDDNANTHPNYAQVIKEKDKFAMQPLIEWRIIATHQVLLKLYRYWDTELL